jgi:hypothetical protein
MRSTLSSTGAAVATEIGGGVIFAIKGGASFAAGFDIGIDLRGAGGDGGGEFSARISGVGFSFGGETGGGGAGD